jgi:arginyl-tRNA--protein-N-Asp/Glu arginylyltransferase
LDQVLALGWYRMHQGIFTCSHVNLGNLYRVHWLRYRLHDIREKAAPRRIKKSNQAFTFLIEDFNPLAIRTDHVELHKRYRAFIDFDGANSIAESLLGDDFDGINIFNTKCISIFDRGKLIAGGYFDIGLQAGTSILHFYDPAYSRYSLGKYLILLTLDYLRAQGCSLYYPGYVVHGFTKMDYKLFLGKEAAQYFEPETTSWRYFREEILITTAEQPIPKE